MSHWKACRSTFDVHLLLYNPAQNAVPVPFSPSIDFDTPGGIPESEAAVPSELADKSL